MSEEKVKLYSSWLKGTIAAIKKFSFYPPGHPTQSVAAAGPFELLQNILSRDQRLVVSVKENKFVINGETIPEDFTQNVFFQLFQQAAVKSVEFKSSVSGEEFKSFLNYYARRIMDRHYHQALEEFLNGEGISSIVANKVHYVEVSERQEVISKTEKLKIDLKSQFAATLKENPQILKEILFGGPGTAEALKNRYRIELPEDKIVAVLEQEISQLSDENLLSLISGKIKRELEKVLTEEVQKKEDLETVLAALQSQELKNLFPQLEIIAERYGLLNQKILKKTLQERREKSEKIVEDFSSALKSETCDSQKLNEMARRLLTLEDDKLSELAIERLIAEIESPRSESRQTASLLLQAILNQALSANRLREIEHIKEVTVQRIREVKLSEPLYLEYLKTALPLTRWLIRKKDYRPVKEIVLGVRSRCHKEVVFSEKVQKASLELVTALGNQETASQLLQDWLRSSDRAQSGEAQALLKLLATEPVIEEILSGWSHYSQLQTEQAVNLLRSMPEALLSYFDHLINVRLGESTGSSSAISSADKPKMLLITRILTLVEEKQALQLLGRLKNDPDSDIRAEAIKYLGLHPLKQEAKVILYLYLKDTDPKIRQEAIESVAEGADTRAVQMLINHFSDYAEDRKSVCQALSQLECQYAEDFFLSLLTGRSRKGFNFKIKPEDEVRALALNYFCHKASPAIIAQLEQYLHEMHKNLFSFLKKDPLEAKISALVARHKATAPLSSQA